MMLMIVVAVMLCQPAHLKPLRRGVLRAQIFGLEVFFACAEVDGGGKGWKVGEKRNDELNKSEGDKHNESKTSQNNNKKTVQ